ncbi:MAG: phospho-sugar mutase [Bacteroidetes bacterium]|nr:MAG: phospho-sugar mutase [Bacteroidota bacterium]
MSIDPNVLAKANSWLNDDAVDTDTKAIIQKWIHTESHELTEAFYKDLDFGTGGMRGIMGVGSNRINKYTLGQATQGLSNYLKESFSTPIKVAIAYDSRNNSSTLAREVAKVFAGNGIHVYLFEELRPTPELSFAVRHLECQAGIVLTASHNPKEYNGYKVYWNDGGQLVPPHDKAIIEQVRQVQLSEVFSSNDDAYITLIGEEVDRAYLDQIQQQSLGNSGKAQLKIVFTPLHGTSVTLMERALTLCGFKNVSVVEKQATPDGNFPTVKSPNPEEAEALSMAVDQAEREKADIVIGCDPDTDRVGIAVRDNEGKLVLLNGNQTGAVLFDYMLGTLSEKGKLPNNAFTAITIVTSDLMERIAQGYNVEVLRCLTGFKWIADLIRVNEGAKKFIVGGEESYGYMIGDFVRDKDAISATVLIAEAAAAALAKGSSYYNELMKIHKEHGYFQEKLISIVKTGKSGAEEIEKMMENFRSTPPITLAEMPVIEVRDYQVGIITNTVTGTTSPTHMPSSNVIQFVNENGDIATARPSGTEPKIKFYFSVMRPWTTQSESEIQAELNRIIGKMTSELGVN